MDARPDMTVRDGERSREIARVTWVGFWVNLVLTAFKIIAGILGNSRAVVADGVHSLSDLVTDVAILVGVRFWMSPPDASHRYGHKRLESIISFFIGALLGLAGLGIAYDAILRMTEPGSRQVGSVLALAAAASSVVIKEILYRWTARKAAELKSEAVAANAWDHRSDAISSLPICAAVGIAMWFPALAILDLIGALLVSLFILYAAWKICAPAANVLMDGSVDDRVCAKIQEYCLRTDGVRGVHSLRTRYVGQDLQLDMHVSVDAGLTVHEGNRIAHALEDSLYTPEAGEYIGVEIQDALIHIDPWYGNGAEKEKDVR